ncbi:DUF4914 family protein [Alkalibacter rhizosphaerae]|uniref:DUF4914 family protein n=1 Tax=Alkalibacter rhizosphaerae TaxID=2815577 RepID=A0A974XGT6_9FIRM|nr:DUF4914 family protein [Alkalibacter rhizosphaerae]QSX08445.1 DUF4914 family protein [Alkalibacter rhizosphaerae]
MKRMHKFKLQGDLKVLLEQAKSFQLVGDRKELMEMAFGGQQDRFDISYEIPGRGMVKEVEIARCKNGAAVNYPEDYMRRRDPDALLVADENDTDKPRYDDVYNEDFEPIRQETFSWLKERDLLVLPFMAGGKEYGYEALLVAPVNAAFFAAALADLQGFLKPDEVWEGFEPKTVVYLAPPFRHTHFEGKQVVIHNRKENMHEVFSYNLYPGPSAKKGIYGVLINIGEKEGWITVHASTVKVVTPYDNEIIIMHEGASGAGKSEMIEQVHREVDGRVLLGENLETKEKFYLKLSETCELRPVTDDMALCHPDMQRGNRLVVKDAEAGWFLRLDHIKEYGTSPEHEKIFIQPSEPLIFLNMDAVPGATCLPWEHIMDSDGKPCPNPRVILPRRMVPHIVDGEVEVDVRSFGVRTPPSTAENPTYGIMGMMHVLPPALAWLWRLVAPRGHNNPSITASKGMTSEGVGSYWPFATGKMVEQANLLLEQIKASPSTRYVLIPNQHIGAYKVGFMPQWIAREYIARRGGAKFRPDQLKEARCKLLGYGLESLKVDGQYIRKAFLQPETQSELGYRGYDEGAEILYDFFKKELEKFNTEELDPLGRTIIDLLNQNAMLREYLDVMPMKF